MMASDGWDRRYTWASKTLWSKSSSLRTARGNDFFLFLQNIQSKVLFQIRFPNKPQSPTLAFMPAHRPLPSKPLLPESAAAAKSLHLHERETEQRNGKTQEGSWQSSVGGTPELCSSPRDRGRGTERGSLPFIAAGPPLSRLSAAAPGELRDAGALAGRAHPHYFPTPTAGWSHSPPCAVSG